MHHLFVDQTRRAKRRGEAFPLSHEEVGGIGSEPSQLDALAARDVADALQSIGADRRAALVLVAVEGLSYAEAAEVLGIPAGTLMSRVSRGREELPADEGAAFERWLERNPEMQAKHARYRRDGEALRAAFAGVPDEPIPPRLSLAVAGADRRSRNSGALWRALAAAVILAVGGVGGFAAARLMPQQPGSETGAQIADRAIAAHVIYAAEKLHVVEVGADQKDHLVGWLSKRVGLRLVAPDLTSEGYSLVGGRLLPAAHRAAAQFMYQDPGGARISLYVTDDPGRADTGFRFMQEDGARAYYWIDGGYGCAIAGAAPEAKLKALARLAYSQLLAGETG
jgi:anti-sigma factor RsiW